MKQLAEKLALPPTTVASLLDLRDEVAVVRELVTAGYMACQALDPRSTERGALAAIADISRDKLEAVVASLDGLIADANKRQPASGATRRPTGPRQGP